MRRPKCTRDRMKTQLHYTCKYCRQHRQVRRRPDRTSPAILRLVKPFRCFMPLLLLNPVIVVGDEPASFDTLSAEYKRDAQPLLQRFCLECHSSEQKAGELDLQRFKTLTEVRQDTKVWLKVAEMLHNGEMPPEDFAQPSPKQRKDLLHRCRSSANNSRSPSARVAGDVKVG